MTRRIARKILLALFDDSAQGRSMRHARGQIAGAYRRVAPYGCARQMGGPLRKLVPVNGGLTPGPAL